MTAVAVDQSLAAIRMRIAAACSRAGRAPESVRLVAVTKGVEVERIRAAVAAGLRDLGENRVQEALSKIEALPDQPLRWHFIGRLQRNKVRHIIGRFDLIHSLADLELAEELDRRVAAAGVPQPVLIQVNVAREPSKAGVAPDAVDGFVEALRRRSNLRLQGLMTIPPADTDLQSTRRYFAWLREKIEDLRRQGLELPELSMGMSADFEVAIEEGATLVRIGSAIFGPRSAAA